jgi:hypothetical protein
MTFIVVMNAWIHCRLIAGPTGMSFFFPLPGTLLTDINLVDQNDRCAFELPGAPQS